MGVNLPDVILLVTATRREFGDSVLIIPGGGAFSDLQELPTKLAGSTVAMNVREALDFIRRDTGAGL